MKNPLLRTKPVTLEQVTALRENATKTGFPKEEVVDRKDHGPYIRHYSVHCIIGGPPLAGCSFRLNQHNGKAAWQLYAVTIHSSFLVWLVGLAFEWPLIDDAMKSLVKEMPAVRMFYSNIQSKITSSYESNGWEIFGEQFTDAGMHGPYQKVIKFIGE